MVREETTEVIGTEGGGGSSQSSTDRDGAPAITGERVDLTMGLGWTINSIFEVGLDALGELI